MGAGVVGTVDVVVVDVVVVDVVVLARAPSEMSLRLAHPQPETATVPTTTMTATRPARRTTVRRYRYLIHTDSRHDPGSS